MDAKKTKKTGAKAAPNTAAKSTVKPAAKPVVKTATKAAAKPVAKTAAKPKKAKLSGNQELMLARVEAVRLGQREGGYFDCFGRAVNGYCDQGGCMYHAECLSVSQLIHSL